MSTETSEGRYYVELAAAFARGKLGLPLGVPAAEAIERGIQAGLRVHTFKQTSLPRVRKVLGILRGLLPAGIVDIGSGRGAFLWPLLDAFPEIRVIAIDRDARHVADILAVRRGGIERLAAARMDANHLGLTDGTADVVTLLEVLEHIPDAATAASEAVRVARRFVVASVPLHEDDNPGHIHLFSRQALSDLFLAAGARRVGFDYVLNHAILVATL